MLPYGHVEDQTETWEFEITTNARLGINTPVPELRTVSN